MINFTQNNPCIWT